jgi:hypothetical protein
MSKQQTFDYGYWRTDGPKEDGFSHELISSDTKFIEKQGATLDNLVAWPYDGVDTLLKAFRRNVGRIPDRPMLGTRVGNKYEW